MKLLEACQKAIAIDSSKSHGTGDLAMHYANLAVQMGLMAEVMEETYLGVPQKLLVVRPSQTQLESDFVMSSHLDTRDPEDYAAWTKTGANPFYASVEGDQLYGLGVAEPKLDFLCKLFALSKFAEKKFKKLGPVLVGGFGAESGMGVMRLLRKRKIRPKYALVGQATQLRLASRAPGYAVLEVKIPFSDEEKHLQQQMQFAENITTQTKMFSGSAPLSSEHDISENPIGQLLNYLRNLPEGLSLISVDGGLGPTQTPDAAWLEIQINDSLKESIIPKMAKLYELFLTLSADLKTVRDPEFQPNYSTVNIGAIKTKPDGIYIYGSCRFVSQVNRDHYEKWLNNLEQGCKKIGGDFQLLDFREPFSVSSNSQGEFNQKMKKVLEVAGLSTESASGRQCSEANVFSRFKVESLLFGAGSFDRGHSVANEKIKLGDLRTAQKVYESAIAEICL